MVKGVVLASEWYSSGDVILAWDALVLTSFVGRGSFVLVGSGPIGEWS